MDIVYRLHWQPVVGALEYFVYQVTGSGQSGEALLGTTPETWLDVVIPDDQDSFFRVRPYDGAHYGPPQSLVYDRPPTLGEVVQMVRTELRDLAADPRQRRFADSELEEYIRNAVADYGKYFPQRREIRVDLVEGQRDYGMPADCLYVHRVEFVNQHGHRLYLKYKPWKAGERGFAGSITYSKLGIFFNPQSPMRMYAGHYDFRAGVLSLDFDPKTGEYLVVRYGGEIYLPRFADMEIGVPESDIELIVLYACGKAAARTEMQAANLDRWREDRRRDDNPLVEPSNRYFNAYRQKLQERMAIPRFMRRTRV